MYPESYFNYRVVKHTHTWPNGHKEDCLEIHEVHYEYDKAVSISTNPITISGDDKEEIKDQLAKITACLEKDTLNYEDFTK